MKYVLITASKNTQEYLQAIPELLVVKQVKNLFTYLANLQDDVIYIKFGCKLCSRFKHRALENISFFGSDRVISLYNFTSINHPDGDYLPKYLREFQCVYFPKEVLQKVPKKSKYPPEKTLAQFLKNQEKCINIVSPSLAIPKNAKNTYFLDNIVHPFNLVYIPKLLPYRYEFTSTTYLLSTLKGRVLNKDYNYWKDSLIDLNIPPQEAIPRNKAIFKAVRNLNCSSTPILVQKQK